MLNYIIFYNTCRTYFKLILNNIIYIYNIYQISKCYSDLNFLVIPFKFIKSIEELVPKSLIFYRGTPLSSTNDSELMLLHVSSDKFYYF